jgi:RNA polymerase sigma-70 factor (ECF subfamily)
VSDPEIAARGTAGSDADRTDRAWMDRLAGGDLGALDRLYEQYGAMAFSIAYRITGDRSAAEDVVQDAFLGAWRNAGRYADARGSVRTWLLSIVHHRAIDTIRRRRPTVELPDSEAALPDTLTLPDAWGDVELRLDREAVQVALTRISEVQREAIELAYFGGLTQTEIAERTGVPLGTVKGRLRLGLQGLRAALLPPGGGISAGGGGGG